MRNRRNVVDRAHDSIVNQDAIGNRGTFRPWEPDIAFSQDDASALNDRRQFRTRPGWSCARFTQSPAKVHWWHKTVGTQYNLAQRSRPFRRVFEGACRTSERRQPLRHQGG